MIVFLYGEDNFRLKQKVRQLKEKFISSSLGDTNLAILEAEKTDFNEMARQILAMPFLSRKRLVIVENLLKKGKKSDQEKMNEFLKKIPESTVLTFVEESVPDRRSSLFKKLSQLPQAAEYKPLEGDALRRWIKKEAESRSGEIESDAVGKLAEYVGSDLWRMSNEIEKLVLYQKKITLENIELFVAKEVQANIFNLIEQTAAQNPKKAIYELYQLLKDNQAEIYILTMLAYQYRNLLIIKDTQERNPSLSRFELAKKTRLHPFVVGKGLSVVGRYTLNDLKQIYRKILNFDTRLKTGKIESRVALELLVFQLARGGVCPVVSSTEQ